LGRAKKSGLGPGYHEEIARRMDVDGRGIHSMLRRTAYKGLNALHAAAGGEGLLPICRYLVEEAKMDVNKRDTFTGTNQSVHK